MFFFFFFFLSIVCSKEYFCCIMLLCYFLSYSAFIETSSNGLTEFFGISYTTLTHIGIVM